MGKKRQKRGHFCWCCARVRPNEKFSGKGHRRHLCRACTALGPTQIAYYQAIRNIDRLVGFHGHVPRNKKAAFAAFLNHPDLRVCAYAASIAVRPSAPRLDTWCYDEFWPVDFWCEAPGGAPCEGVFDWCEPPACLTPPDWLEVTPT